MNAQIIAAASGNFNEVCKNLLQLNYQLITETVVINPTKFASLCQGPKHHHQCGRGG
jgi:hypothetical protein